MKEADQRIRFPLSGVFLLMIFCAILAAMLAAVVKSAIENDTPPLTMAYAFNFSAISGMFWGGFIGMLHYRLFRGILIGAFWGFIVGGLIGPFVCATNTVEVFPVIFGGSILMVVVAFLSNLSNLNAARRKSMQDLQSSEHVLDATSESGNRLSRFGR